MGRIQHHLVQGEPEVTWADARTFLEDWQHTSTMAYAEHEATGLFHVGAAGGRAELSLRYIHEESGDYDREVTVAALRVAEGLLWLVVDETRHPDTGEVRGDATALRAFIPDAPREPIDPFLLGHG